MRSAGNVYTRDMADTGRCEQSAAPAGRQRQWAYVRRAGLWQQIGAARAAGDSRQSWDTTGACLATRAARRTAGTGLLGCSLKLLALAGSRCRSVRNYRGLGWLVWGGRFGWIQNGGARPCALFIRPGTAEVLSPRRVHQGLGKATQTDAHGTIDTWLIFPALYASLKD